MNTIYQDCLAQNYSLLLKNELMPGNKHRDTEKAGQDLKSKRNQCSLEDYPHFHDLKNVSVTEQP